MNNKELIAKLRGLAISNTQTPRSEKIIYEAIAALEAADKQGAPVGIMLSNGLREAVPAWRNGKTPEEGARLYTHPQPIDRKAIEDEWIPAAERLPTHAYSVLGYVTKGGMADPPMIDIVTYVPEKHSWLQFVGVSTVEVDGKVVDVYQNMDSDTDCRVTVTHWRDLPDPPIEGKAT